MLNLTVLKLKSLPEQDFTLALTPGVRNVNHAFSQSVTVSPSCRKMSLQIFVEHQCALVCHGRGGGGDIMNGTTYGKHGLFSVVENTFFSVKRDN
jgi:hypothetical protein